MLKLILGAALGVVAWFAVVIGVSFLLREFAPALGAEMNAHATTISLCERLAVSFLASLTGGWVAALVGGDRMRPPVVTGVLMLLIFVPYHLYGRDPAGPIWTSFPIWYHLTFFVSLLLLSILGGRLKSA